MNHNISLKLFSIGTLVRGIIDSILFSLVFILFFLAITLLSDDQHFKYYLFTSGSDDFEYLTSSVEAALDVSPGDLSDILEKYFNFSQHSPGYPVVLYILFKLTVASLFTGIFLNGFILWVAIRLITFFPKFHQSKPYNFLTVFYLSPGLLIVSLHLYKDLFLLALTLISIISFKNNKYLLAIFFALLSHYFRPFNWVLIFVSIVIVKRPKILIYLLLALGFTFIFNVISIDFDNISAQIQFAQLIAMQDMRSYGSNYEPTGNFALDYLTGLIRFILLPFPFSINWTNRPIIFSTLDFFQSIVIWIALFMVVYRPRRAFESMKNNSIFFIYTILHASTYSVIYFGNGDSRYRLYIYVCAAIIVIDLSRRMFRTGSRAIALNCHG